MGKPRINRVALEIYKNELCKPFCHLLRDLSILDVGCGDGNLWVKYFYERNTRVIGIDITYSKSWKIVSWPSKVSFVRCDANHLPFKSSVFDLVFAKDTLHHVATPHKMLDEMFRVSNSMIVVIEANRYNPVSYMHMVKLRGHKHLSQDTFRSLLLKISSLKRCIFKTREVHYVPTESILLLHIFWTAMRVFERIPLSSIMQSYNIAIMEKRTQTQVQYRGF